MRKLYMFVGVAVLAWFASSVWVCAQENPEIAESPYGVYADLIRGQEHESIPKNLELMKQAGIAWVRWDFYWNVLEEPRGTWHLDRVEDVLEPLEAHDLNSLIILGYQISWANPAHEHPDAWREYLRKVVTKCKGRVRYWEVWNEENIASFWKSGPDPKAYTEFLKITYQTIKEIDPSAQVVYGGLAEVPFDFYEKTLREGAGEYFDVINIHPYRGGMGSKATVEKFLADLRKFHDLTVQYCGKDKPLWITEMGWATPPALVNATPTILRGSLEHLFPQGVPGTVAVISDPCYPPSAGFLKEIWAKILPENVAFETLRIADLRTLDPAKYPVLVLPPTEAFPTACQEEIRSYVKDGGTLIALGGIPFYYRMEVDENGVWKTFGDDSATGLPLAESFRVHWYAWWTRKNTPRREKLAFAPGFETLLAGYPIDTMEGPAFFSDEKLHHGDSMVPLLVSRNDANHVVACIYKFRSDWKGNIVLNTVLDSMMGSNRCDESNQGVFLSQAVLLALSYGVDRFFPYEFQSVEEDEADSEHHFGITHANLSPKSGYLAYATLTRARPAGSTFLPGDLFHANDSLCKISWRRPDGQTGIAVWSLGMPVTPKFRMTGTLTESFDVHGRPVTVSEGMTFTPRVTYFIGKDLNVDF